MHRSTHSGRTPGEEFDHADSERPDEATSWFKRCDRPRDYAVSALTHELLYELKRGLHGKAPRMSGLRVDGCQVCVHAHKTRSGELVCEYFKPYAQKNGLFTLIKSSEEARI